MKTKKHSTCSRPDHALAGAATTMIRQPKRPPRRPVFTLTPRQVFQRCREKKRSAICARQVLAVRDLMCAAGWPIKRLAKRAHVSVSHLSDFLNVKKFFTTECVFRVARAFGLQLSTFDEMAEKWRPAQVSP